MGSQYLGFSFYNAFDIHHSNTLKQPLLLRKNIFHSLKLIKLKYDPRQSLL